MAIVPEAVVENPQPTPWITRNTNKKAMLNAKPKEPTDSTKMARPIKYTKTSPL